MKSRDDFRAHTGLVKLKWLDSMFCEDDQTEEEALNQEPSMMETVGYLLADTESKVVVAGTKADDGTYRAVVCVPKGVVIKVEEIC